MRDKENLTVERYHFNKIKQEEGDTFDQFLTKLKVQGKNCEFQALGDTLIVDRIVLGIISESTRERLLRTIDLDLKKATEICKAAELVKKQSAELSPTQNEQSVHSVRKQNTYQRDVRPKSRTYDTEKASPAVQRRQNCRRCGYTHGPANCPAFGEKCHKCGKENHFSKT